MMYQTVFILFAVLTTGILGKSVRILGGTSADITSHPYMVSIRFSRSNVIFCGGVIISNKHILTAAHCFFRCEAPINEIKIYSGVTRTADTNGGVHEIDRVFSHPGFTGEKSPQSINRHDIAVVKVKETIQFNEFQKSINLPVRQVNDFATGLVLGWGSISHPTDLAPEQLQTAPMKVVPTTSCSRVFPFTVNDEQFCAFESAGIGPCIGDSGGPLIVNNKIVGIISFNFPCAQGIPDIYTRVYSYINFVRAVLNNS